MEDSDGTPTSRTGFVVYNFSLDTHVPPDHLLRPVAHFFDFANMRRQPASFYSSTVRPSVDSDPVISMLLVAEAIGVARFAV